MEASKLNYVKAIYMIGNMYYNGIAIKQNNKID